ncbi:hypothetical protein B0O99DRAFT_680268 [Bisporella sp. PMI_857]|nr:hypothetical protein B0O99DRAFT_680268 [Bisporella sp. PMI_857]
MNRTAQPTCARCRKPPKDLPKPLMKCAKCRSIYYCSKKCASEDTKTHKASCKRQDAGQGPRREVSGQPEPSTGSACKDLSRQKTSGRKRPIGHDHGRKGSGKRSPNKTSSSQTTLPLEVLAAFEASRIAASDIPSHLQQEAAAEAAGIFFAPGGTSSAAKDNMTSKGGGGSINSTTGAISEPARDISTAALTAPLERPILRLDSSEFDSNKRGDSKMRPLRGSSLNPKASGFDPGQRHVSIHEFRIPFTSGWLKELSEQEVFDRLVDCFRRRVLDEKDFQNKNSMVLEGQDPIHGFRAFLDAAESRPKLLPPWWNARKRIACEKSSVHEEHWSNIELDAFKISDGEISEHYGDPKMATKLRMMGFEIYEKGFGLTPGLPSHYHD